MPNQEVGVKAVFDTRQFTRGLNRYISGLARAATATVQTAAVMGQLSSQAGVLGANLSSIVANTGRANSAIRGLGSSAGQSASRLQTLNVATVALGTVIGQTVVNALSAATRGTIAYGRSVLESVTFFERLGLTIEFFTARALIAEDATLDYSEALRLAERDATGLSFWLQRLAVASPFTTRDVGTLFRVSQAYGLTRQEAERLTPLLLDFGAAAGLTNDILERLALAFGQVRARGKLTGEEVRQLGNSGLPVRDILVEALGIANDEFDELLEAGAFTSDVVLPALTRSLEKFRGAGERVSFQTIGGIVSAFQEFEEITRARFFTAALKPLQDSFQALFKTLNQPEVLAFLEVLGEEIGTRLLSAFQGIAAAITNTIAAWRALEPATQQQIIVFAGATVGALALIGALGLLTFALSALINPVTVLAVGIGFLVSEWSSGFRVIRYVVGQAANAIRGALNGIGGFFENMGRDVDDALSDTRSSLGNFVSDVSDFAADFTEAFVGGLLQGIGALGSFFSALTSVFTYWLKPSSPPNFLPDSDQWARDTAQGYLDSYAEANPETPINKLGQVVKTQIRKLNDETLATFNELNPEAAVNQYGVVLTKGITKGLNEATRDAYLNVASGAAGSEVAAAATQAGISAGDDYVNGFLSSLPALVPQVSAELAELLARAAGGAQLSRDRALSITDFFGDFQIEDFDALDQARNAIQEFTRSLIDTGDLDELELPRVLFEAGEQISRAIDEFRRTGNISDNVLAGITNLPGGEFASQIINSYTELAVANDALAASQEKLNAITDRYRQILKPLEEQLNAINEAVRQGDEEERILSLQRTINNRAVSDRRRLQAQREIEQILAQRRVRSIEQERDAAVEAAEEEVDARQKQQEAVQKQFDLLRTNIDAQLQQIGLVGQEGSILIGIEEQIEKLREKQKTQLELQQELLRLQGEEMADLERAARARYVLDQAESTELERQQALLDLQEVGLRRQARLLEARELGIPEEELTKLRDIVLTLEDIGVRTKEGLELGADFGDLETPLVNAAELTEEWEAALAKVRDRWNEIKQSISETATEINNSLPTFLRFLPAGPAEEPPIIGFIRDYGGAIVAAIAAIKAIGAITAIIKLTAALKGLFAIGGGAAAAGGGAVAGAVGSGALAATGIVGIGIAIEQMLRQAAGMPTFLDNMDRLFKRVNELNQELEGETFGTRVRAAFRFLGEDFLGLPLPDAGEAVPDNPESGGFFAGLGRWRQSFVDAFVVPEEDRQKIATSLQQSTSNLPLDLSPFRIEIEDRVGAAVREGIDAGLSPEGIAANVSTYINEGIALGLLPADQGIADVATNYMNLLIAALQAAGEIESPSALSAREIGTPLGEGVTAGFAASLNAETIAEALQGLTASIQGATGTILAAVIESFTQAKQGAIQEWRALRVSVTNTSQLLLNSLTIRFTGIATLVEEQSDAARDSAVTAYAEMRRDVLDEMSNMAGDLRSEFEGILADLSSKTTEIKDAVVGIFGQMRTESEQEVITLRTNITLQLVGEEDSLLSDIRRALLGENDFVPRTIGQDFMEGLALGITESRQLVADALTGALLYALAAGQAVIEAQSPSERAGREIGLPLMQGVALYIDKGAGLVSTAFNRAIGNSLGAVTGLYGTRGIQAMSNVTTITNRTYNLNVGTNQASQGVINDFGIMKTMALG